MYEIVHQAAYRFFGIDKIYKLLKDEMYEIGLIWIFWNWLKFEYEYSRICVASVVRAQTLCCGETHVDVVVLVVWVVFVWFVVCYVWLIKLGCIRCCCGMNILNFGLSLLCLVYMKFLKAKVLELGCKRCIDWKQWVKIFLPLIKMGCLRCFCCAMKFLMSSVVKLGCKRCIAWKS